MKAILFLVLLHFPYAQAEQIPHGHVMCEGDACREAGESSSPVIQPKLPVDPAKAMPQGAKRGSRKAVVLRAPSERGSNLPFYFEGADRIGPSPRASAEVTFTPKSHDPRLDGLKTGDVLHAVIEQAITASPELPTPIRARVISGTFLGSFFVGEATLEKELKRVVLTFTRLRLAQGESVYTLKAQGLSVSGSVGLTGEYVSESGKFFLAEMASAGAAGFLDSTISRNQTTLGTYQQEPSLSNSGKAAAVTALSKTTDRMADQVREKPGYTHVAGYQEIEIMVTEDPVEAGN